MSTTAEILRGARKLIATKGWTQNAYARDAVGCEVDPEAMCAAQFCMSGALVAIEGGGGSPATDLLQEVTGTFHLYKFNDALIRTKEEVLSAFDRAIALAESR